MIQGYKNINISSASSRPNLKYWSTNISVPPDKQSVLGFSIYLGLV
jgi:hypothetical protein